MPFFVWNQEFQDLLHPGKQQWSPKSPCCLPPDQVLLLFKNVVYTSSNGKYKPVKDHKMLLEIETQEKNAVP